MEYQLHIEPTVKDEARNKNIAARNAALWRNPANGILRGISKNEGVPPARAIWEMVQNARDQSRGTANIKFIVSNDNLVFMHDGIPFDQDTIKALILQTSSKNGEDPTKAGQYGTGFLTTHLFGRLFYLKGSVILTEEYFYNFEEFKIDRTPNSSKDLIVNLQDQCEISDKWIDDDKGWSLTPVDWTEFRYPLSTEYSKKNAKVAFENSPSMAPYVMAMNPTINSISFEHNGNSVQYNAVEFKDIKSLSTEKYSIVRYMYRNNDIDESKILLVSKDKSELNEEPLFTVVLPLKEINEEKDKFIVEEYKANIPNLMIYLPLMGTENWGINFVIHSRDFTCSNDNRDSLRFVDESNGYQQETDRNTKIIERASDAILSFVNDHYSRFYDKKYLTKVNFNRATGNDELNKYYQGLEDKYTSGFRNLKLVTNAIGEDIAVSSVWVLSKEITENISDDSILISAIFYLMKGCKGENKIPKKEELLYWSQILQEWYPEEDEANFVTFKALENYIDETEDELELNNLLVFDTLLKDLGILTVFNEKKLLPTEKNVRKYIKELKRPISLHPDFKSVLDVIIPDITENFIHPNFAEFISDEYTDEHFKKDISEAITATRNDQEMIRGAYKDNKSGYDYPSHKIDIEIIDALISFVEMQMNDNSVAFYSNILRKMKEFYGVIFHSSAYKIEKDKSYDFRPALRVIINDALYRFTIMEDKDKIECSDWIKECVSLIYGFDEARKSAFLDDYKVYRNKNDQYDWADKLYRAEDAPDALLDIYDEKVNKITQEQMKEAHEKSMRFHTKSIRNILVDESMEMFYKKELKKTGEDLGKEIYKEMVVEDEFWQTRLTNEANKTTTLDVINKIQSKVDNNRWKVYFPGIHEHCAVLFFSLVASSDERKSKNIFKLINKTSEELESINELLEDPDLPAILTLGRVALLQKKNENSDFEYKKTLGNYVEDIIKEYLEDSLDDKKLEVVNEQDGKDIVIMLDDVPIYYIEVKSRWASKESVMMSKTQTEVSFEHMDNYALVAVDMVNYPRENAEAHVYPDNVVETKERMKVLSDIGTSTKKFADITNEKSTDIHIGGDFKTVIPQNIINCGQSFDEFIITLTDVIKEKLQNT